MAPTRWVIGGASVVVRQASMSSDTGGDHRARLVISRDLSCGGEWASHAIDHLAVMMPTMPSAMRSQATDGLKQMRRRRA